MANAQPSSQSPCLSDLMLDRLLGDEVLPQDAAEVQSHMSSCERCQGRLDSMRRFRDGLCLPPLQSFAPARRPMVSRTRQRIYSFGATLAVAASLVLWMFVRSPQRVLNPVEPLLSRTKGSSNLGFYLKRGEQVMLGAPGDILHPGDNIEFTYRATRSGYIAVLSLDGNGKASIYYPDGPNAAPLDAGEQLLPLSTVLDDALGTERVYSLFCANAVPLSPLLSNLETTRGNMSMVPGCVIETLHFEKRRQ